MCQYADKSRARKPRKQDLDGVIKMLSERARAIGERYNVSDAFGHYEYLVNELRKIGEKRDSPLTDIPETFAKYIPE